MTITTLNLLIPLYAQEFYSLLTLEIIALPYYVSGKKEVVYCNASKQVLIFSPPVVLTLHLKRFSQVGFSLRKVSRHVDFPMVLDIAPYCSSLCQVPT